MAVHICMFTSSSDWDRFFEATHSARRLMSVDANDRPAGEPSDLDREEFARLFSRNARRIYGFIMTLVFNHHDAEEVFQNTNVVLWNKFADFQPGSNFFAWASKIAYYEVLSLMKQKRRSHTVSDES